jgi:DNA mismatch repair protein MutH
VQHGGQVGQQVACEVLAQQGEAVKGGFQELGLAVSSLGVDEGGEALESTGQHT